MHKILTMTFLAVIVAAVTLLSALSQGAATLALGVLIGGGMCTSAVAVTLVSLRRNDAYEAHQRYLSGGQSETPRRIEYHDNRTIHLHNGAALADGKRWTAVNQKHLAQ